MLDSVEGIVVREKVYGESSKIIDVFTKKYGLISILSKGSKRLKSNLSAVSSKLTYGTFNIYYKENKLSTLTSVDVINSLKEIKKDIKKIGYATYLCELIEQVLKQVVNPQDREEIFDLFIAALIKITENYDTIIITNILELKLLDYLGVSPLINGCAVCGDRELIITLSSDKNGFLCKRCRTNERLVNLNTIKYLRMYYYVDISKITTLEVENVVKNEIDSFLNEYYEKHTGLYLNTKSFLRDLKKIGC